MVIFHSYVSLPEGSRGYMVVCCSLPKNADVCAPNMTWDGTYPRWPAKKKLSISVNLSWADRNSIAHIDFFFAFASMEKIEIVLSWWVCIVLWDDGSMVSRLSSAGAMEPLLLQLDDEGNAQARGQGDGLGHKKCLVRWRWAPFPCEVSSFNFCFDLYLAI